IIEGRGINGKACVHLDLRHLGHSKIMERLPQVRELALNYINTDCIKEPIPIQPTAHYSMGGIPANTKTEVIRNVNGEIIKGLYTAGEASCLSLHGANRLGTNSVQGAATFGRIAGESMSEFTKSGSYESLIPDPLDQAQKKISQLIDGTGKEKHAPIREELQENMTRYLGIFRNEKDMLIMKKKIKELQEKYRQVAIDDKGEVFNLDLIEAFELRNLLDFSEVLIEGALARRESRGAHYRTDFPKRDDEHWLKHTLSWKTETGVKLDHSKKVIIYWDRFPPQERKY
ncbi:MAG: FAD-binding protein, partial [Candidatus Aminicenantes bacterium]|nr:FAD-binding protein [Candidatus Aminicenantes bacterium]